MYREEYSLKTVRNISYRGGLDTCNYTCSYCPFGRKSSLTDTTVDCMAWERFINRIAGWEYQPLRIMVLPYGEAMVHTYYREGIIRLSKMSHVVGVSCQTNLSFSESTFLKQIREYRANPSKIKIWASFHPEMVSVERFVGKVHKLQSAGIDLCVGVVGNPEAKVRIAELRKKMDPRIYLFVNAMQGLRKPLSGEDIRFFKGVDNLFEYDRLNAMATPDQCSGGRTNLFVNCKGEIYSCPRSGVRLGNLYDSRISILNPACRRTICDCYIAYSNLVSTPLVKMMGEGALWRIPDKKRIKAVFFDIDGTLTDSNSNVPERYAEVLTYITGRIPVYLATSLPVQLARKKLGKLYKLFNGGVFADGGYIRCGELCKCIPVEHPLNIDEQRYRIISYTWHGEVYKYAVIASGHAEAQRLKETLDSGWYHLYQENRLLTIVDRNAGKKQGLLKICEIAGLPLEEVLAVGNTMQDWPMLSVAGYSCAVLDAERELKKLSGYILNPDSIPAFFEF